LYLIAHHERTGRPLLWPQAARLGLAGALLSELVPAGAIGICRGEVITGRALPEDGLAAWVLGQVASDDTARPVADWLAFLARTAPDGVARRLEHAGYLVAVPARPWRVIAACALTTRTRTTSTWRG
jgi:Golgi phosphoprotein 3 (GPP34)